MIIGITGGSGSGKTTVSGIFAALGADIIDTDKIAHDVTKKDSDCLKELGEAFGDGIILPDGSLNRRGLAQIAFSSPEKTGLLNKITHKYIKAETERRIAESTAELIGIDGAVIIGSSVEALCEKIVLVTADRETRIERIKTRDNLTDVQALERLNAQPDEELYRKHSDYIVDNSTGAADLENQVRELYNKLKEV